MAAPLTSVIPTALDGVDAAWLGAALGVPVRDLSAEPLGQGVGFVGALARVRISSDAPGAPSSVIVKLPSASEESLAVATFYRFYEREAGFYRDLARFCRVTTPRCFHVAVDTETHRSALVLEDLTHLRGVDQVAGAEIGDIERSVDALAVLHAQWWGDESLDALPWLPRIDDPINQAAGPMYEQVWPGFLERYGAYLQPEDVVLGERVGAFFPELLARCATPPFTLNHGDYRIDNLLFRSDGSPVLLDWQLASRAHAGAFDLAYLVAGSVDPDQRDGMLPALADRYLAALAGHGVTGYGERELFDDLRLASLILIVYAVIGAKLDMSDPRGVQLFERFLRGYFGFARAVGAAAEL